ncbi:hypothetical protein [Deinococcus sp. AJ005]|uniref:hypothetical protein n=1 Tax=Deinococcus sp. AJ005 TaxID=2652443 RepID=UPI00186574E1|nr:hypothetical protein [Deinococcus sp. AJ005]
MTTFTKSARALRRNNPLLSLVIAGHLLRQKALGHFITRVDVPADPANGLEENAAILAGPRQITVKLGQATAVPWQLLPRETLDAVLGALYAQIVADGAALPELLVPLAGVNPEDARASKALTRRLRGALGLRSVLDLSASWVDAPGPTHGWPSGTRATLHRDDMH